MAAVSQSTIEDIRSRIDLADLVASYGIRVKRVGASYTACCPFHHEKTPSFHIRPERGMYHCFGCGESGDCFKFVMKQEGYTFLEAVKKLAQQVGVEIRETEDPTARVRSRLYALHAELAAFFRRCLKVSGEAAAARAYLESRAIPDETAESFLIGYAPRGAEAMLTWAKKYDFTTDEMAAAGVLLPPTPEIDRWYNRFGGRLMFSIRDRAGRVIAFSGRILDNDKSKAKYVNSPETEIFRKSNVLYAFDKAAGPISKAPNREAIVCEGQIDVIRCHMNGFNTAIASQGTAFTEEHVRMVKKCADSVTLVFDADGAGYKAAVRTGGEFLAAEMPVRVATLPPGEDPDSLLRSQGAEAFRACLRQAESITRFQVRTMRAAEADPDAIDAVRRVSRAALETIAKCPSAVMRTALVKEAAELMNLPVSALEADFAEIRAAARRTPLHASRARATHVPDPLAEAARVAAMTPGDARVEPPPKREIAFCEFLFSTTPDTVVGTTGETLGGALGKYLPPPSATHPFLRDFIATWRGAGDWRAFRERLTPGESAWLDGIFLRAERATLSELPPARILEDFLRALWCAAVKRVLDALPVGENDARRLELAAVVRAFQRGRLEKILPLMRPETLGAGDGDVPSGDETETGEADEF